MSNPEEQALAFFIERGEYSFGLAESHFKDKEPVKAKKLFMEAFNYYMKAFKGTTDQGKKEELKQKLVIIKTKGEQCG